LEGRRSDPPARGRRRRRRRRSKEDELVFILRTIILSAVKNHLVTRKTRDLVKKAEKNPSYLAFRWTRIGAQRCEIFMCSV
jgi:hypothetical protein